MTTEQITEALRHTGLAEFMVNEDTEPAHVRIVRQAAWDHLTCLQGQADKPDHPWSLDACEVKGVLACQWCLPVSWGRQLPCPFRPSTRLGHLPNLQRHHEKRLANHARPTFLP